MVGSKLWIIQSLKQIKYIDSSGYIYMSWLIKCILFILSWLHIHAVVNKVYPVHIILVTYTCRGYSVSCSYYPGYIYMPWLIKCILFILSWLHIHVVVNKVYTVHIILATYACRG